MKYKITGIDRTDYSHDGLGRFSGFILEGVLGSVDVFVDGYLKWDDFGIKDTRDELKWALGKIGSYIFIDEIVYIAIATRGKVAFDE